MEMTNDGYVMTKAELRALMTFAAKSWPPHLSVVCFDNCYAVATDGHTMAVVEAVGDRRPWAEKPRLVQVDDLKVACALKAKTLILRPTQDGMEAQGVDPETYLTAGPTVNVRLFEATFPDWRLVMGPLEPGSGTIGTIGVDAVLLARIAVAQKACGRGAYTWIHASGGELEPIFAFVGARGTGHGWRVVVMPCRLGKSPWSAPKDAPKPKSKKKAAKKREKAA